MTPQLFQSMSTSQQEKIIEVCQKQVDTKRMEVDALAAFREHMPIFIVLLLLGAIHKVPADRLTDLDTTTAQLKVATEQYFQAKHSQVLLELEQLELSLKAIKSMQSPIVGARFSGKLS